MRILFCYIKCSSRGICSQFQVNPFEEGLSPHAKDSRQEYREVIVICGKQLNKIRDPTAWDMIDQIKLHFPSSSLQVGLGEPGGRGSRSTRVWGR